MHPSLLLESYASDPTCLSRFSVFCSGTDFNGIILLGNFETCLCIHLASCIKLLLFLNEFNHSVIRKTNNTQATINKITYLGDTPENGGYMVYWIHLDTLGRGQHWIHLEGVNSKAKHSLSSRRRQAKEGGKKRKKR